MRRLADILNDTGLTEIEVERGDLKIRVARTLIAPTVLAAPAATQPTAIAAAASPAIPAEPGAMSTDTGPTLRGEVTKSPMVGTVYLQAKPGDPPFVRPGDQVSEGQTLMIIEAMKTMNPIPARKAGKVVELLVGDAQPVEFGEPLVIIQ